MTLIKTLLNLGTQFEDPAKSHLLLVQNSFALVSSLFAIPFEIYFIVNGNLGISGVFLAIQLILITSLYLNHTGNLTLSKYVIIGIYSIALPVLTAYIGFDSGFYLYYFLAPILIMSIFDLSEIRQLVFSYSLVLISLVLTILVGFMVGLPFLKSSFELQEIIFKANFTIGLILLTIMNFQLVLRLFKTNTKMQASNRVLKNTLNEKDVLLAEVHHRVKNNLAVMTSLMNLQQNESTNAETKDILAKNSDRLRSMSIIHNHLYDKGDFNAIQFNDYLKQLSTEIIKSYKSDDLDLRLSMNLEKILIPLTKAVPLGLITNEIIVNAFKHGFKNRNSGCLTIKIQQVENEIEFLIKDDGNGFDPKLKTGSMGITLIDELASQIDARLTVHSELKKGCEYHILFSA